MRDGRAAGTSGAGPRAAEPFAQWYERAGVRAGARRMFDAETEQGRVFFPAALVPCLAHEAVRGLAPQRRHEITVRHLYQFLLSTTHLETRIVNGAAELIANDRAGVDLPAGARLDAFKIYCDEGYHALYSLDLAAQIAAGTGIAIPDWDYGGLVDGLLDAGRRLLPEAPRLAALLQAVVFETLVTAVLNELPGDPSVVGVVRDVMRDHARDEGRHHRFFAAFFTEMWAQLDAPMRVRVAALLPVLIRGCLEWDTGPVRSSLRMAGLADADAGDVAAACYGAGDPARVRDICQATVRICAGAGVLDTPGAEDAFAAHGLPTDAAGR